MSKIGLFGVQEVWNTEPGKPWSDSAGIVKTSLGRWTEERREYGGIARRLRPVCSLEPGGYRVVLHVLTTRS